MFFCNLELESVLQVNDRTRLDARKCYQTPDEGELTSLKIKVDSSGPEIDILGNSPRDWFLDWQYDTAGTKHIKLTAVTATGTYHIDRTIHVIEANADHLFSSDNDLIAHEPDILKWVPEGKNSFLNVHRAVQALILDWLDSIRIWRDDGTKLTKEDVILSDDLKQLSTYWTLHLIYRGIQNKPDDVFAQKASFYQSRVASTQQRGRIQADYNGNGELDSKEANDMKSFRMVRR